MRAVAGMEIKKTAQGDLRETLAHHDAAIQSLGGRMSSLETGMRTLQGEVHTGFTALGSKLDKLDAEPRFDFHQTVSTVTTIAVLFSMVVGGIIYITSSQFAVTSARVEEHSRAIAELSEKSAWLGKVDKK